MLALTLPDLGLDDQPLRVSLWLVEPGSRVQQGDPIVEILAGATTVDLPAPADGVLAEALVDEDEAVEVGQRLAMIREP